MRRAAAFIIAGLAAVPLVAADQSYAFRVSITNNYDALVAIDPASAPRYAADRPHLEREMAILFSNGDGPRWKTVMGSCPGLAEGQCEEIVNATGGASRRIADDPARSRDYDVAFRANPKGDLRLTCLRSACGVHVENVDHPKDVSLARDESVDVPSGSDLRLNLVH